VSTQGRALFYWLSGLAFVYCLFIGARVTSDCLSQEKRDGTLGLLFLTDLRGLDVVLGKLVASSLNSFYGLFAVLPLLAFPLLLGGVTLAQFGQMVLVLLNTLFFSLSVGIFVSALSHNERKAMSMTALLTISPAAIPLCIVFFMVAVLERVQNPADLLRVIPWLVPNPIFAFVVCLTRFFLLVVVVPEWMFWVSLAAVHVFSWIALAITAWVLPAVWKDRARTAGAWDPRSLIEAWKNWTLGNAEQRQALRERLMTRNPFLWLVSRDRLKPGYAWLFLFSMIGVWLWGYWQHREVMFDFYPLVPTVLLVHGFLKVWVVSEVSFRLVEDQRNGALELLLSTPLTVGEIQRGQSLALVRQFAKPILVLCGLEVVTFQSGAWSVGPLLAIEALFLADLATLARLAMRFSLQARTINEVLLKSMFLVLVLPCLLFILAGPLCEVLGRVFWNQDWTPGLNQRLYLWSLIGIATDVALFSGWLSPERLKALPKPLGRPLQNRLRALSAEPIEP
jgi:hypothetical protein